jgi:hypothetical protein
MKFESMTDEQKQKVVERAIAYKSALREIWYHDSIGWARSVVEKTIKELGATLDEEV